MASSSSNFVRGLGIAMAIGSAATMIGSSMMKGSKMKKAKKTVNKAFNTMADIVDNVQGIMQ
ncbi:MAG: hypothetical protein K5917_06745 [Clostridiales bacterium]|nr:hypothetical protein [Clostridiales bacterium]